MPLWAGNLKAVGIPSAKIVKEHHEEHCDYKSMSWETWCLDGAPLPSVQARVHERVSQVSKASASIPARGPEGSKMVRTKFKELIHEDLVINVGTKNKAQLGFPLLQPSQDSKCQHGHPGLS